MPRLRTVPRLRGSPEATRAQSCSAITGDLPGPGPPLRSRITAAAGKASGPVNRRLRFLAQSDPATRSGFMIADAVRYMSVHS
jgi:hypothetical protein